MSSFAFKIENGKVQGRETLWASIKRLFITLPDGEYLWSHPAKPKNNRSIQQNKYYWGVICDLVSKHTGYLPYEAHQEMGKLFLSYEKNGKIFVKSTTKLKTVEFENYMESCRRWGAMELQVYIPMPNEPDNYFYDMPERSIA